MVSLQRQGFLANFCQCPLSRLHSHFKSKNGCTYYILYLRKREVVIYEISLTVFGPMRSGACSWCCGHMGAICLGKVASSNTGNQYTGVPFSGSVAHGHQFYIYMVINLLCKKIQAMHSGLLCLSGSLFA